MFRVASLVSVLALTLVAVPAFAASASPAPIVDRTDDANAMPETTKDQRSVKPCIPIYIWIGHGTSAVKVWSGVCKAGTGPKS